MELREIEEQLSRLRQDGNLSFMSLRKKGLPRETVMRIEGGGNYNVGSLFKYLELLFYLLTADGTVMEDAVQFGATLKEKRRESGKTLVEIAAEAHVSLQTASCVETGQGYRRSTLLAYMKVVPVELGITSMFDAYK